MKEVENIIDEKKQGEAASPAKKVTTISITKERHLMRP